MANIQTLSLNVIKKLAEKELSDVNGTSLVNIIALNVFNDEDDDFNHLIVHADLDECDDEKCNGPHPWVLDWDYEEDEFVGVMRLDQVIEDEEEEN